MSQLRHILRFKFIAALKPNQTVTLRLILRGLGITVVYLAFAFGAFIFTEVILRYTLTQTKIGLFLLHEFIGMLLFVFFVAVNIGNLIVAYATLYKSEEVAFLMTKPLPPEKIFLIKFLDNFFYSSGNFIVILLASILAYAHYFKINLIAMVAILLTGFFPFTLSAGMIGVLLLLIILRIATRIGLKALIMALSLIYASSLVGFFQSMSPSHLVNAVLEHYPAVDQAFNQLLPPVVKFLPNQWLASALFWLVKNDTSQVVRYSIYQLGFCLGLLGLTLFLGYRLYYQTWLLWPNLKFTRPLQRQKHAIWLAQASLLPPRAEAIVKRDLLNFVREPSQIWHLVVMLIFILIFISSIVHINLLGARTPELQTWIYLTVFSFNAFLIASLALRFVFPLISLEGLAFWKVRSAPISVTQLVLCKLLPYLVVILISGELLSLCSNYRFSLTLLTVSAILTGWVCLALTALNFGMGGLHSTFAEKSPVRISSSPGATLSFLLSLIYIVLIIGMLYFPVKTYFATGGNLKDFQSVIVWLALISLAVTIGFYHLGLRSFQRDF